MVVNLINKLLEIGFSEYEAKSYIALLTENPMTSYEIAKHSSIPTSKIYEVINKLLEKGIVLEIEENNKRKYIPISSEELLDNYKDKIENTIEMLKIDLSSLKKEENISYIWNINNYEYLINKSIRIIENTKHSLIVSCWPEEFQLIEEHLKKTESKGIKIAVVFFGKTDSKTGKIFPHPIEDTIYNEKGGRGLAIVSDSTEALTATIYNETKVEGALSRNKGFVTMTEDYLKHDIYIMKLVYRFDDILISRFGKKYKKLRDIFSDEEENL
jgi:HTH-type transcriptional regulator, sugar sensing transcriptional regulator